jgi:signal transduction histidine kinase
MIIIAIFLGVLLNQFYRQSIKTVDHQLITVINEINYDNHFYTPFSNEEFMIKNLYITIYEKQGEKFSKVISNQSEFNIGNLQELQKAELQIFTTQNNLRVVRLHSAKVTQNIYIEVATTLNDKIESSLNHLEDILITLIPMLLVVSIIVGYFIIKNSLIPVKKVIDEVKNIEANHLEKRIKSYTSNDEIEQLVTTFNFMLDKLDDSFKKIKRFSNDVSHELKTPLTVIRGEIELGLRKDRTNKEYKQILHTTLEETKQLQELINSLLFLSKANKKEMKEKFEYLELDEIVTDVISSNKQLIKQKNIKFEFKEFDSTSCYGHPLLLKILVGNIIENSIKYSHKNSTVDIYLHNNTLKIKDYGIGIQKQDIDNIFDRFYRIDEFRGRGGYGLGLSIVKSISQLHGFKIDVNSNYNEFTEFIIHLNNMN